MPQRDGRHKRVAIMSGLQFGARIRCCRPTTQLALAYGLTGWEHGRTGVPKMACVTARAAACSMQVVRFMVEPK